MGTKSKTIAYFLAVLAERYSTVIAWQRMSPFIWRMNVGGNSLT
jgi:hypothetical protein